ncbi:hypothetical protein [Kushneria sp. TE3]|uniref:hypothetical protein n=1 Tax=Kushneria sp. TE3 TaxID=3449832 RepID=UPI003F68570F
MNSELMAAKKYGLFWSHHSVWDEALGSSFDGLYIYQPDRFWQPFWVLFNKLGQLNDYCFNQLVASETKLNELRAAYDCAVENKASGAEVFDFFSEEIPIWEDNIATFAKATPIVLLASFTEWGLKHIVESLFEDAPKKKERGISDIRFYVRYLVNYGVEINNVDELILQVDEFRVVRNNFAHGKWSKLEEDLHELSLKKAFTSVSKLFEEIEDAAWRIKNVFP